MILFCIFQVIDHAALKPVRQTDFGYEVGGICVTSHWLVVTHSIYFEGLTKVYSIPDLKVRGSVPLKGWWPRADRDGRVYVPYTGTITITNR